jgi:hypothetical protein
LFLNPIKTLVIDDNLTFIEIENYLNYVAIEDNFERVEFKNVIRESKIWLN